VGIMMVSYDANERKSIRKRVDLQDYFCATKSKKKALEKKGK
jgi:hypothetical protein